jgi:lipoprotein-anchoring transpeptidase ErfK/SrfK
MREAAFPILGLAILLGSAGQAEAMTAEDIEAAQFSAEGRGEGPDALTARLQILLDRNHVSPGVIDGYPGENVEEALRTFETMKGLEADGVLDETAWAALVEAGGPVTKAYTIVEDDLSGLVRSIPEDFSEMAKMERAGYTSVEEELAERFHMDVDFLKELNPEADFSRAGTEIVIADTGKDAEGEVDRIEVTKEPGRLLARAADGSLVAAYPVTVGSDRLPSPSGTHEVKAIAIDATYSYLPDENFRQGDDDEPLELPPGPNNPVGGIWIDLTEPTYGLHGTPDPSLVGKTQSHGCVRMTNWDARELASLVRKGTKVAFLGD